MVQLLEVVDLSIKLFEYESRKPAAQGGKRSGKGSKQQQPVSENKERLKALQDAIMNPGAARDMLRRRKEMELRAGEIFKGSIVSKVVSLLCT